MLNFGLEYKITNFRGFFDIIKPKRKEYEFEPFRQFWFHEFLDFSTLYKFEKHLTNKSAKNYFVDKQLFKPVFSTNVKLCFIKRVRRRTL